LRNFGKDEKRSQKEQLQLVSKLRGNAAEKTYAKYELLFNKLCI